MPIPLLMLTLWMKFSIDWNSIDGENGMIFWIGFFFCFMQGNLKKELKSLGEQLGLSVNVVAF